MRTLTAGMFVVAAIAVGPAIAQQSMPKRLQKEADKSVKTQNSGADLSPIKRNWVQPPTRRASRTAKARRRNSSGSKRSEVRSRHSRRSRQ